MFTLISSLLSFYGISEIYKGKTSESTTRTGIGVLFYGIGIFGIAFMNPVSDIAILNILVAVIFWGLSSGLMAYTFKDTHAETVYASLDVIEKENKEENKKISVKNYIPDIIINNLPVEKEKAEILRK